MSLVPERRVDKNGVTTTRWIKRFAEKSKSLFSPPPTPVAPEQTARDKRLAAIDYLMFEHIDLIHPMHARELLHVQSAQVLGKIDETLSRAKEMSPREQRIAAHLIFSLDYANGEIVAEALDFMDAFCSANAVKDNLDYVELLEYVIGSREDLNEPILWNTEAQRRRFAAIMQYAYETNHRVLDDMEPVTGLEHARKYQMLGRVYLNHGLKELVREHSERVDELVALSLAHRTADPQLLRSLIEHDGPTAVATGWL